MVSTRILRHRSAARCRASFDCVLLAGEEPQQGFSLPILPTPHFSPQPVAAAADRVLVAAVRSPKRVRVALPAAHAMCAALAESGSP